MSIENKSIPTHLNQMTIDGDKEQQPPVPSKGREIADLVIEDIQARKELGIRRYGVPLQAGNGRDALLDAYQEAIDLACYLRQALEERNDC